MPKVKFEHSGRTCECEAGEWMYDVADRAKGGIPFACKAGACGTCATELRSDREGIGAQTAREVRTLEANGLDPTTHCLPCLADVHGDVVFGKPVNAKETGAKLGAREVVVESYRPLNLTVAEVRFFAGEQGFEFKPGQFMIFNIPHPEKPRRRSYSISTPPSDRRHFEICVRSVAGGHGSNYVHRMRPGNVLNVEGPYGKFVLREDSERDILMIATGTGLSPIKSMLLHLLDTRSARKVRLFFGLRHQSDLFYTDLLRGLAAHYPSFEYRITLSAPDPESWAGPRGRVTDLVDELVAPADAENTEVYLCGGRKMIEDCKKRLTGKGFPAGVLHHENFY
jgi:ferredoxin-NADP reductase/ferredoxin